MAPPKGEDVKVMVARAQKQPPDIGNILQAILDITTKTADFEKIDKAYTEGRDAADLLLNITGHDLKRAIEQNIEEAVEQTKPYDPTAERITVRAPTRFGEDYFTTDDDQKLHEFSRKYKHSSEFPTVEMCLKWMVKYHTQENYKFNEETWRENLLAVLPTKEQHTAMSAFIKKGVPAKIYFIHLQTSFKGTDSKQDALLKLQTLLADHSKPHIEIAKGIERLILVIEDNAEQFVYAAVNECLRFYASYAGAEVAEKINVSFNARSIKNYSALLECIRLNEHYIKEGRDRVITANSKRVRQVRPEEDEYTIQTQQNTTDKCNSCGQQGHYSRECTSKTCYTCQKPGHISRFCPTKSQGQQWQQRQGGQQGQQQQPWQQRQNGQNRGQQWQQTNRDPRFPTPRWTCFLHPQSSHQDSECTNQMTDPCSLLEHQGMRHGNQACTQQRGCKKHNNSHKEKECPDKRVNQTQQQWRNRGQQQGPQGTGQPQWPQRQNQQQNTSQPQRQQNTAWINQVQGATSQEVTQLTQRFDDLLKQFGDQ